jgi:hypothetical protein
MKVDDAESRAFGDNECVSMAGGDHVLRKFSVRVEALGRWHRLCIYSFEPYIVFTLRGWARRRTTLETVQPAFGRCSESKDAITDKRKKDH